MKELKANSPNNIVERLRGPGINDYELDIGIAEDAAKMIEKMAESLRIIGYPRRGTDEENWDIYDAAKFIQANYSLEDLNP